MLCVTDLLIVFYFCVTDVVFLCSPPAEGDGVSLCDYLGKVFVNFTVPFIFYFHIIYFLEYSFSLQTSLKDFYF